MYDINYGPEASLGSNQRESMKEMRKNLTYGT
jgi:hypothetical protein